MAPDYLRQLISVLPPSKYDLRRNHDSGILLASQKVRTKITLGDRSFTCAPPPAPPDFGTFFYLQCGLFPV